jgi:hypothetical protein
VSLAGVVACVMLALVVGFLALILLATLRQMRGEVRRASEQGEL